MSSKSSGHIPVVDVDQAFPALVGSSVGSAAAVTPQDQGPAVQAAIRDVLGVRSRTQDPKAFTDALTAAFRLTTVEGHTESQFVPRGYAVQADLGAVTGGQASLYRRASIARTEVLRILDGLRPLRVDGDPEDMEAYRTIVRNAVQMVVDELGYPGGPRVAMVDSYLDALTGHRLVSGADVGLTDDPDDIGGQLGALRDRFGLIDANVNTIEEEGLRTAFWTLVDMVTDLRESWDTQKSRFEGGAGDGFLGTELIMLSRLLEAASDQVDELESVLDSVLIPQSERQTILVDKSSNLTLDGLLTWLSSFLSQEGRHLAQDAGRDGIVAGLAPGAVAIAQTFKRCVADQVTDVQPSGPGNAMRMLPTSCCTKWPPGMYAARVVVAVSSLCRLLVELARRAQSIGRFPGLLLLDVSISQLDRAVDDGSGTQVVNLELRGHNFRPGLIPAIVTKKFFKQGGKGCHKLKDFSTRGLLLPLEDTVTGDDESITGLFRLDKIRTEIGDDTIRKVSMATDGIVVPAAAIPIAVVDTETVSVIHAPTVRTWPRFKPADRPRKGKEVSDVKQQGPRRELLEFYERGPDDLSFAQSPAPTPEDSSAATSGGGNGSSPKTGAGSDFSALLKDARQRARVAKAARDEALAELEGAAGADDATREALLKKFQAADRAHARVLGEVQVLKSIAPVASGTQGGD